MAIKDILLHYGTSDRSAARANLAMALAKRHGAHLTAVYTVPGWPLFERVAAASGGERLSKYDLRLEEQASQAKADFSNHAAELGIMGEWRTMKGRPADSMVLSAKHADLVVIGQANPDQPSIETEIQEEVVLGSGRPVLIVPYAGDFPVIGRRVMVAWNGSRECARAIHDAIPLLSGAEEVIVYGVNLESERYLPGTDIATHLARHGLRVSTAWVTTGPRHTAVSPSLQTVGDFGFAQHGEAFLTPDGRLSEADALLAAVSDYSVDLLVMGAYGHSRAREIVLGGVTRQFFQVMTVPVLMSH